MRITMPSATGVDVADANLVLMPSAISTKAASKLLGGLTRGSYPKAGMSIPEERATSIIVRPFTAAQSFPSIFTVIIQMLSSSLLPDQIVNKISDFIAQNIKSKKYHQVAQYVD